MKTVGIIGGSGFIGSYNTKKFLAEGFRVKVSATDLSRTEKYDHLKKLPKAENLEIVQLDMQDKAQVDEFLKGCSIVVHGGTPFQLDVQDPQTELFDPTIKGTENFLEAVKTANGIEKVVFIASVAACNTNFPLLPAGKGIDDQIDESDTPFMSTEGHPYAQAKFLANKAIEKFVAENAELPFEITSVSPTGVMGNALSQRQDSTSMGLQFLFKNKIAPNPFIQMFYDNDIEFALIDVKDVAEGVYKAATTPGLHGKNYLLTTESYRVSDITLMLNKEEPLNQPRIVYRNDLAQKELGLQFKPVRVALNQFSE